MMQRWLLMFHGGGNHAKRTEHSRDIIKKICSDQLTKRAAENRKKKIIETKLPPPAVPAHTVEPAQKECRTMQGAVYLAKRFQAIVAAKPAARIVPPIVTACRAAFIIW